MLTVRCSSVCRNRQGGAGAGFFAFTRALTDAGINTINDFNVAQGDRLCITRDAGGGSSLRTLWFERLNTGTAAAEADDRLIFDAAGALYYDADGTGSAAQVQFATLVGVASLSASNVVIVVSDTPIT